MESWRSTTANHSILARGGRGFPTGRARVPKRVEEREDRAEVEDVPVRLGQATEPGGFGMPLQPQS
jgi:hypothetical protein